MGIAYDRRRVPKSIVSIRPLEFRDGKGSKKIEVLARDALAFGRKIPREVDPYAELRTYSIPPNFLT